MLSAKYRVGQKYGPDSEVSTYECEMGGNIEWGRDGGEWNGAGMVGNGMGQGWWEMEWGRDGGKWNGAGMVGNGMGQGWWEMGQ